MTASVEVMLIIDVDLIPRNGAPARTWYSLTLAYIFEVKIFKRQYLGGTVNRSANDHVTVLTDVSPLVLHTSSGCSCLIYHERITARRLK